MKFTPESANNTCTRSHPHENMDAACELRTEIARLTNKLAQRGEPVAWIVSNEEGDDAFVNNKRVLPLHHHHGNAPTPLYTATPDHTALLRQAQKALLDADKLLSEKKIPRPTVVDAILAIRKALGGEQT
jgi:hypothetical protein